MDENIIRMGRLNQCPEQVNAAVKISFTLATKFIVPAAERLFISSGIDLFFLGMREKRYQN
jgi:hypothetical protein